MFLHHFPFMCCDHPTTRLLTWWLCKQSVLLLLCPELCLEGDGGREAKEKSKQIDYICGLIRNRLEKALRETRWIMISFLRMLF